jgi:putative NADPH-quinone reductase
VTTTGASADAYTAEGMHQHPFSAFEPVVRQTAQFCGMQWLDPFVVHGAIRSSDEALADHARRYRARLIELGAREASDAR